MTQSRLRPPKLQSTRETSPPANRRATTPAEFLANLLLQLRGITISYADGFLFAPVTDNSSRTPVAPPHLAAPISYGDDDIDAAAPETSAIIRIDTETGEKKKKGDATLRDMEADPAERPAADYLSTTQQRRMTARDRAGLVWWMYDVSTAHGLPPAALHRAVSYIDRFLSANKIERHDDRTLLCGAALFAAAKYEKRCIEREFNADVVAEAVGDGCERSHVLAAERELVAALGYRLGGPTADTFVDHFTRHDDAQNREEEEAVRDLAHHLADLTLLDYRCCTALMPSAVAAAAILLAGRVLLSDKGEDEVLKTTTGYTPEDLTDIMDAIYMLHQHEVVKLWPGCDQMMNNFELRYELAPRCCW